MKKEALRATTTVPVAPTTLYFAWLGSEQHAAMTGGAAAKIEPTVGAKFSTLGGYVTGKLVILDLGRRIVMSWRTADFPRDAHDSRVEVHFEALGASTRILVLHTDVPEGQSEKYKALWNDKYFAPMRTYFSKLLPDPRNPPVRRPPPPPPEDDEDEDEDEEEETPKGKGAKKPLGKGPSVAKTDAKSAKGKPAAPAKAAPAKGKPAAPAKAAPAKGKPAKPARPAPKKPAPKPAKPAPKKPAPKKPAPKPTAKKPAPKPTAKKPAPKPTAKKKR